MYKVIIGIIIIWAILFSFRVIQIGGVDPTYKEEGVQLFLPLRSSLSQTIDRILPYPQSALLSGIILGNQSSLPFYFKKQLAFKRETGLGFSAIAVSFLGLGCSACGSLILSSLIGLTATTAVIDWLPLEGLEFGLLGIFILLLAIYLTAYKISAPNDCKV